MFRNKYLRQEHNFYCHKTSIWTQDKFLNVFKTCSGIIKNIFQITILPSIGCGGCHRDLFIASSKLLQKDIKQNLQPHCLNTPKE